MTPLPCEPRSSRSTPPPSADSLEAPGHGTIEQIKTCRHRQLAWLPIRWVVQMVHDNVGGYRRSPRLQEFLGGAVTLLWLALFLSGCKEYSSLMKAGPLFAAEEKTPPAKAVVYIYWPQEGRSKPGELWVMPCGGMGKAILPGGYTSFVVEPGQSCFQVEKEWSLASFDASVSELLAKVDLNSQPGHSVFARLEYEGGFLSSRGELRLIPPEVATPEIGRCRRTIPSFL
jgi:hypothetical protein